MTKPKYVNVTLLSSRAENNADFVPQRLTNAHNVALMVAYVQNARAKPILMKTRANA